MQTPPRKPWLIARSTRSPLRQESRCRKAIFKRVFSWCAATQRRRRWNSRRRGQRSKNSLKIARRTARVARSSDCSIRSSDERRTRWREGKRAMELKPIAHDVIEGALVEVFYALICAQLGRPDEAIS